MLLNLGGILCFDHHLQMCLLWNWRWHVQTWAKCQFAFHCDNWRRVCAQMSFNSELCGPEIWAERYQGSLQSKVKPTSEIALAGVCCFPWQASNHHWQLFKDCEDWKGWGRYTWWFKKRKIWQINEVLILKKENCPTPLRNKHWQQSRLLLNMSRENLPTNWPTDRVGASLEPF